MTMIILIITMIPTYFGDNEEQDIRVYEDSVVQPRSP